MHHRYHNITRLRYQICQRCYSRISWNDKDGNKRRTAEVVADNVYFGDSKSDNASAGSQPAASASYGAPAYSAPDYPASDFQMLEDDDAQLPF